MKLTLREFLDLQLLRRAQPEILCGHDALDRPIRWLHHAEVVEIARLLKGGEVLLTTGLGLVGASDRALARYVDDLADRGIAALIIDLGWSFMEAPVPLVAAARRRRLPLIVLHTVVPWVEVTRTVSEILLGQELDSLRRAELATHQLNDVLLSGEGLEELMRRIATLAGTHATLGAAAGHVVASSDPQRRFQRLPAVVSESFSVPVSVFGTEWGRLHLDGTEADDRRIVLERAAVAVALELVRSGHAVPSAKSAATNLLVDMAEGTFSSAEELVARASLVGFIPRENRRIVGIAVSADRNASRRTTSAIVEEVAADIFDQALVADAETDFLLAAIAGPLDEQMLRMKLWQLANQVDKKLGRTLGAHVLLTAGGPIVGDVPGLARSLRLAREALTLASNLGLGIRVLLSSDIGVHRLIARLQGDGELDRFIGEQLGPLLATSNNRGPDLVGTLEAYLNAGRNKALTARSLGIRRQSLYSRLERIEELLGGSLDDAQRAMSLSLALVGWRVRSAGTNLWWPQVKHQ